MKKFGLRTFIISVIILLASSYLVMGKHIALSSKKPANLSSAPVPLKEVALPQKEWKSKEALLDVPLLNQMDQPRLYNGCEVTSLAMILNYKGVKVSKNDLAKKITRVPLKYGNGEYGNPNLGFVGNMEDGPGLGVYHNPIFTLANSYAPGKAEDLTGKPFDTLIEELSMGNPVWVITTVSFAPVGGFEPWPTAQGPVNVTFKMHSVAVTGYDEESIYINDPYGTKNKKVNRASFQKAWEQMGKQAVVVR